MTNSVSEPEICKASFSGWGVVTAPILNVRAGRGTEYQIIGRLKRGAKVKLIDFLNGWWQIDGGYRASYVGAEYIDEYRYKR